MQRKRDGLIPIEEVSSGLGGPVKKAIQTSSQALHHFTQADQVNQLVNASEADPDLGFMAFPVPKRTPLNGRICTKADTFTQNPCTKADTPYK